MNSDYIDLYKRRVLGKTKSRRDKQVEQVKKDFIRFLKDSPTSQEIQYTKVDELPDIKYNSKTTAEITDIANNDKTALDEKFISVTLDTNIDVGSYVWWRNSWWLLIYEEVKSIEYKKKFTMRRCNYIIKSKVDDVIYNIPLSISNLTMYSSGLDEMKYMTQLNSKRNVFVGSNPITRQFGIGHRMMLTQEFVYKINHINDFEYTRRSDGKPGLIKWLVAQVVRLPEDYIEDTPYDIVKSVSIDGSKIDGDNFIYLGATNTYSIDYEGDISFMLDANYINVELIDNGDNTCELHKEIDFDDIGDSYNLIAKDSTTGITVDIINIVVRGM